MVFPRDVADALLRVLLAPGCAACREPLQRPLQRPVCERCWADIKPVNDRLCACCGDVLGAFEADSICGPCSDDPPAFSMVRSAGVYGGSLREIVHAFKFERRRCLASPLAGLMHDLGGTVLQGAQATVPVPVHPWRGLRRGFNQAADLARCLPLPVWPALRRRWHGQAQMRLGAGMRRGNVEGAFAVRWNWSIGNRRRSLHGATVILIDDVMTTGATLRACAAALRQAGVSEVRGLTVARSVAARPRRRRRPRDPSAVPHR